ncbi:MAG: integrin alpha [Deltaproteobacteria bacterium]|nr:integrin alpha [Deltaproteobacteria bacterium]
MPGDVNHDGYDDVIVGAPDYPTGQRYGIALLYLGTASGLDNSPAWSVQGSRYGSEFSYSVASAGDVNNDGFDDVIIGAHRWEDPSINEGAAFLYLGSKTGLSTTHSWTKQGNQTSAYFGKSLASAGDINKDGYDDVLVGAPIYTNGQSNEGRAYLYYGMSTGLNTSPAWTAEVNVAYANLGSSLSSAGDVNGDTYTDVIVGADHYTNDGGTGTETYEGAAFVYYGSPSGLSTSDNWHYESNQSYANCGSAVSGIRDVNHDGYDDVMVGCPGWNGINDYEGVVLVFYGSASRIAVIPKLGLYLWASGRQSGWIDRAPGRCERGRNSGFRRDGPVLDQS